MNRPKRDKKESFDNFMEKVTDKITYTLYYTRSGKKCKMTGVKGKALDTIIKTLEKSGAKDIESTPNTVPIKE